MKKMIAFLMAIVVSFALAACGCQKATDGSSEIHIRILNEVDSIYGIGLTYYFDGVPTHSSGMKNANGKRIDDEYVNFTLTKEDVPLHANLETFGLQFMVTEENGVEFSICTVHFPVRFGNTYTFTLSSDDGCYAVFKN